MLVWFLPVFLVLLLIGLPVFFALLFAPGALLWLNGQERDLALLYRNVYNGMDSFPLMAIPFFMLAGELMNRGGITMRLVNFSQALMGHLRGGLAHVNVLSSMLFAGLSGSAVADTSALGSMLIPAMEKNGYSRKFAAAITAASSVIGPIIPPSGIMIIYAYVMGESVAALFLAGIVPGILVGVGLMLVTAWMAGKQDFPPATRKATWSETGQASLKAFFPLMTPVIILGGILGGAFTPTEASAVAAAYALLVSLFILKSMTIRDLPGVLTRAAMTSAVVLLLVGSAMAFKTVVSLSHAPEALAGFILTLSENPLVLLFLINLLLFRRRHVPGCGAGDHHPRPDPRADLHRTGHPPRSLRYHHEREPDRGPRDAADGTGTVCCIGCVGRKGRDHRPRDPAVPGGRDRGDLPDHLRAGSFVDGTPVVRVHSVIKTNTQ